MERGFARPGADLGADSGADFIFERRGIVGRLVRVQQYISIVKAAPYDANKRNICTLVAYCIQYT